MLSEYDKSERAQMLRDARAKDELERATIKIAARKEGLKEGREEGLKQGLKEGLKEGRNEAQKAIVLKLYNKGMSSEEIKEMLDLELSYVENLLKG